MIQSSTQLYLFGSGRYDHQGTHRAVPGGIISRWNTSNITPGILPFAVQAAYRCLNRPRRFRLLRYASPGTARYVPIANDCFNATLPWRPFNYHFQV